MEFYFGGRGGGGSGRKKETAQGIKRGDTFASFDTLLATLAHTHSHALKHAHTRSHLEASCLKNLCPVSISLNWDSGSRRERESEGEDSKEESEREECFSKRMETERESARVKDKPEMSTREGKHTTA